MYRLRMWIITLYALYCSKGRGKMPKRLGTFFFGGNKNSLEKLCDVRQLNEYEKEIIIRIYHKKQSLNYIADTMEFDMFGKDQKYYSVRAVNNFHKDAFDKLMKLK